MKIFKKPVFRALVGAAVLSGMFLPAWNLLAEDQTITGEVVDLVCYLDHGAKGEKHASCAEKCITSGTPIGLLTADDQLYLVVGNHKPMNDQLAAYAAKKVTLKGKVVEKNGVKMIQNAEIQK
jgi:hypothetical protein